ncbi:MAG: reductive dehalogenase [Dehalococcoides mccartyi]|jgi:reductive dehalogenase|uniref:reductive dehalogenase n=2 Tax=Dehalococcoidaceae TaxID=1202464 RepID=UPI0004E02DE3|nr:reductive dehalogenase [Dehalococcoides mccartyi]UZH91505.1 reductive dehalogenase [uncultured bacterium]AII60161.1 hypothetical protein X793_00475 [Dehalococcoides mccartyi CG4]MCF7634539.1 Tetrachloroethene reductive dehalogenase TceA [Dehalococcoides mccartyi]MEA2122377.1 hypothetical protein [Dehalococcoides mccartyi]UZH91578.1 reductive dehalogenase [uncultured bacterium]
MQNFHSTVSRREFMKGLGLTASLGAVSAATPVFHDLDEVIASPSSNWKRPWFVKERDFENPTVDVDWSRMQRRNKTFKDPYSNGSVYDFLSSNPTCTHPDSVEMQRRGKVVNNNGYKHVSIEFPPISDEALKKRDPNWTTDSLKNLALRSAVEKGRMFNPAYVNKTWFLGLQEAVTPTELGLPNWSGTPEENLKMLHQVGRLFGAAMVSVTELTENTKKLICRIGASGKEIVLDSQDPEPHETATQIIIPSRFKYLINFPLICQDTLTRMAPSVLGLAGHHNSGAHHQGDLRNAMQAFLRGLGYTGLNIDTDYISSATAVTSGIAEHSRGATICSPEYGMQLVCMDMLITDMPLTPTKPIDAGINKFCYTCKICAESCPSGALSLDTDPVYDVDPEWRPGALDVPYAHKAWHMNNYRCYFCAQCHAVCPFSTTRDASIHNFVMGTVTTTSILNGFFANMERTMGYGLKNPDSWWDHDIPLFGISTKFTEKRG